jgi:hypothetical protein
VRHEPPERQGGSPASIPAIGEIVEGRGVNTVRAAGCGSSRASRVVAIGRRRQMLASAFGALVAVLLITSQAAADRVALLGFEGANARAFRWRIASALKRAGHTLVRSAPPKNPDDPDALRTYAERRRVDKFVGGASSGGREGWELVLTFKDADGGTIGSGLTFTGESYRSILKEIRADGAERLDSALSGASSSGAKKKRRQEVDLDDPTGAPDDDAAEAPSPKKKRNAEEAIDLDGDSAAGAAAGAADGEQATFDADEAGASEDAAPDDSKPRTAKAKGWFKSSSAAAASDEPKAEGGDDDGTASLAGDGSEGGEVGADEESSGESGAAGAASADPTVVVGLNAGFVRRTLTYVDDLYGRLRAPNSNAWVYRLQAGVYPFARPVKNRLGLIGGYEAEFSGVVRDNTAGTDFGVTFSEIYGGVKARQPLGPHEIALEGTIGSMQSGLDDPEGVSGVPEIDYTSLRAAVDVGLHFGRLSMSGGLGYRLPIGGFGEASGAEWFPRMQAYGLEGSLGLSYRISKEVSFDVSGSMRRYVLSMNSEPEDAEGGEAEVAGGAVDLYLGGYFGLSISL